MTKYWNWISEEYCDSKDFVRHVIMLHKFVFRSASDPCYLLFITLVEFSASVRVPRE